MNDCFFLEYSEGSPGSEGVSSSSMTCDLLRSPFVELSGLESIPSLNSLGRLLSVGLPRCLNCTPLGLVILRVQRCAKLSTSRRPFVPG
jgi:hypothetical protein